MIPVAQHDIQVLEEGVDADGDGRLSATEIAADGGKTFTLGHDVIAQFAGGAAGELLAFLYDIHGSTRALVDTALSTKGRIKNDTAGDNGVQAFTYDAYGKLIATTFGATTQANALTNLLYSGEFTNAATGQQYLRARFYDPATGRFNRLDPFTGNAGDPLSLHKYLYTHGNPIIGTDPSGRGLLVNVVVSAGIGALVGGISGAAVGASRGAIKGGLEGALAGALNGFLGGIIAGSAIGAGAAVIFPFLIYGGVSTAFAGGSSIFLASTPFRIKAYADLVNSINAEDPVDISFATLGVLMGYLPLVQGPIQSNAAIGGFARSLPFVRNFRLTRISEANAGTGGGKWNPAFTPNHLVGRFEVASKVTFVRVLGANSNATGGSYMTLKSEIAGLSPQQIRTKLGLDFLPTQIQAVRPPIGSEFWIGQINRQPNLNPPIPQVGGIQLRSVNRLPDSSFSAPQPIQ